MEFDKLKMTAEEKRLAHWRLCRPHRRASPGHRRTDRWTPRRRDKRAWTCGKVAALLVEIIQAIARAPWTTRAGTPNVTI